MHVIATAGHVDHGKSTLVRALTGMEPDRWSEEKRRGMTIDLGFAWTTLPSGAQIAFVDVPGHERFMTNMLAGVGPVPVVLFVVAADEGWSVQSGEHLAALDTFGVRHGLVAVTRTDLADPTPVMADAVARLARTSIGAAEAVAVDSISGQGVADLRAALDRLIARLSRPDTDADVRLWVDRGFTITGLGTVVTGTLGTGTIREGDELELLPRGRRVAVRGLESLKQSSSQVNAVARVAVNLRGVGRSEVKRGDVLVTPGKWWSTSIADALLTSSFTAEELGSQLVLHIGSAAVAVRLRAFSPTHLRLTLPRPLPLRIGDVALLRDPAQQLVVGRVTLLDVAPPRRRHAEDLHDYSSTPDGAAEVVRRGIVRGRDLLAMGACPPGSPVGGDWYAAPSRWEQWKSQLTAEVARYAAEHPTDPGLPLEHARQLLGLPDRQLVRLLADKPLVHRGGRLFDAPAVLHTAIAVMQDELRKRPFFAPEADRLAELGLDRSSLAAAVRAGELLKIADGIYLMPGADLAAAHRLSALDGPFTLSQARQELDTTRRVAVPLLELLDQRGLTRRVDAVNRVIVPIVE